MEGIQMSTYLLDGVEALIGDHQMSVSRICGELEGYWGLGPVQLQLQSLGLGSWGRVDCLGLRWSHFLLHSW